MAEEELRIVLEETLFLTFLTYGESNVTAVVDKTLRVRSPYDGFHNLHKGDCEYLSND